MNIGTTTVRDFLKRNPEYRVRRDSELFALDWMETMTPEDKVVLAVTSLRAIQTQAESVAGMILIPRTILAQIHTLAATTLIQLGVTTDVGTTQG